MTEAELDRHTRMLMENDGAENAPPGRLLRWIDRPEDLRPYKSPLEEYCKSAHLLTAEVLKKRWDGLVKADQIDQLFERPFLVIERQEVQSVMLRNVQGFDVTDSEFKRTMNVYHIARVLQSIEVLSNILDSGKASASVIERYVREDENGEKQRGSRFLDEERFITPRERVDLEHALDEKMKLFRLLTDQATEIKQETVDVKVTVLDQMRKTLAEMNPEYAQNKAIAEGKTPASTPPIHRMGQVIDAEATIG